MDEFVAAGGTAAEFAILDVDGSGFVSSQELGIVASRAAARDNFKNLLVTATDDAADAVREENFRAMLVSVTDDAAETAVA